MEWYDIDIEGFWDGTGHAPMSRISVAGPQRALFDMAIYGSLCDSTLEAGLDRQKGLVLATKLYSSSCIQDWYYRSHRGFDVEVTRAYRDGRAQLNRE